MHSADAGRESISDGPSVTDDPSGRTPPYSCRVNQTADVPADFLRLALSDDPARPVLTFYDDATGERVELSVATLANWVAKTANLLQDDLAVQPGDRVALLLPGHWQTAAWLLACFAAGVVAAPGGDPAACEVVVSGPDALEAARACRGERVALSLRPLGVRFPAAPEGFSDYAVEVPSQGDRFTPYAPVEPDAPALALPDGTVLTGEQVVARARADAERLGLAPGDRLLSGLAWDGWAGLSAGLLAPLAAGGSVVLCRHLDRLDAAGLERRRTAERVTHTAPQGD
jgi:uncharacterized protein (TIGR03089 family)